MLCDKGLPGVRAPKQGQTMIQSMSEQIFELQRENQMLKEEIEDSI